MDVKSDQSVLKIQRTDPFWAKGGEFKVFIDGKKAGIIETNGIEEFSIEPGLHRISIKMGWSKSNEINIESVSGKTSNLICGFNGTVVGTLFVLIMISFFSDQILKPYHLGAQLQRSIDIYYFAIIFMLTIALSFLPSAMAYIKKKDN